MNKCKTCGKDLRFAIYPEMHKCDPVFQCGTTEDFPENTMRIRASDHEEAAWKYAEKWDKCEPTLGEDADLSVTVTDGTTTKTFKCGCTYNPEYWANEVFKFRCEFANSNVEIQEHSSRYAARKGAEAFEGKGFKGEHTLKLTHCDTGEKESWCIGLRDGYIASVEMVEKGQE